MILCLSKIPNWLNRKQNNKYLGRKGKRVWKAKRRKKGTRSKKREGQLPNYTTSHRVRSKERHSE